jgi:hypothetical protein
MGGLSVFIITLQKYFLSYPPGLRKCYPSLRNSRILCHGQNHLSIVKKELNGLTEYKERCVVSSANLVGKRLATLMQFDCQDIR